MPPCCMGPFGRPKLQTGSIDLRRTGPIGATHAMRAKPDRARVKLKHFLPTSAH